jgi:hypothetical protein
LGRSERIEERHTEWSRERTLQGCHCISSSRRCRRRRTADGTQTTTGNVITAAQKQWDSWVTREAKARSTVVSHGIQAEIEYMWSANDIYRPSAPHTRWTPLPVAPTSLRAFHHHSDSYCDNLHKLMQSANQQRRRQGRHSISCLLMKAVLILNHSQHTLYWQAQRHRSHTCKLTKWERRKKNLQKWKNTKPGRRLSNMRVMVARWVYCETGKPSACKARSVPKGFSQIEGIDFNELFAFNHLQSRMRHQSCFSQQ